MEKNNRRSEPGRGIIALLKRFWYYMQVCLIGVKWSTIETLSRHKKLDIKKLRPRTGEVVVITGGARGIGLEVIKKLLELDMHVIMGCRNVSAGNQMVNVLRQNGVTTGTAESISLDLMSLASVKEFADKVLAKNLPIHILLNNAGIMFTPYTVTVDDLEAQFQVNYLSHFLLTHLLLPRLISAGTANKASRIVNVSSCAHYGGKLDFNDLQMEKMYSAHMAYMNSKLMQVVSTMDFNNRLRNEDVPVRVYSVHPGVVRTELYENVWWVTACSCLVRLVFKTPEQGADGVAFVALSPDVETKGGHFFANSSVWNPNSVVRDTSVQKKLWNVSAEIVGIETSGKEFVLKTTDTDIKVEMK